MYNKHPERGDTMNEIEKLQQLAAFGQKIKASGLSPEKINVYLDIPDEYLKTIEEIYFNQELTLEERRSFQEIIEESILEKHITEVNPSFLITLAVCKRVASKKVELHRNEKAIEKAEKEIENLKTQKRVK